MPKKILITGGAGFIGSHLADAYLRQGWEVGIIDNFSTGNRSFCPEKAIVFEADITNREKLEEIFKTFQPDVISHHAANVSLRGSLENPFQNAQENILGAMNIFSLAGRHKVSQVIFASTGGAMVDPEGNFPATEEDIHPLTASWSPYTISKFSAEKYLEFFANKYGFNHIIFRYSNVFGPRQLPSSEAGVIAIFCEKMVKNEPLTILGDGYQCRDFIFIDDIVRANLLATETTFSGTFHLGSGKDISILSVFDKLKEIFGFTKNPLFSPAIEGEFLKNSINSEKWEKLTGWKRNISFEEGIQRTTEWWKQQK